MRTPIQPMDDREEALDRGSATRHKRVHGVPQGRPGFAHVLQRSLAMPLDRVRAGCNVQRFRSKRSMQQVPVAEDQCALGNTSQQTLCPFRETKGTRRSKATAQGMSSQGPGKRSWIRQTSDPRRQRVAATARGCAELPDGKRPSSN